MKPLRFSRYAAVMAASLACLCVLPAAAQTLALAFTRTYSPLETDKLYRSYLEHLARCTGAELTNHFGLSLQGRLFMAETVPEAQIPALLQANRLQMALVSSALAVRLQAQGIAGPVAVRGQLASQQPETFELLLLTRADSGPASLAQAAHMKIAFPFAAPSGADDGAAMPLDAQLAMAALARAGLMAGKDYRSEFAGGHERALVGLQSGFWQAAFIASDQFDRMVKKREARVKDFKVLWRSAALPTESFVVATALPEAVRARATRCTLAHRFTAEQARLFEGSDTLLPASAVHYEAYQQLLQAASPR